MSELKVKAFRKLHKKMLAVQKAEGLKNNKAFLFKPLITLKLQSHFPTIFNLAFSAFKHRAHSLRSGKITSRVKCLCSEFVLR